MAKELVLDEFKRGAVKPRGRVILFMDEANAVSLWELSPAMSKVWLSGGPEPGGLISLRVQ